MIARSPAAMIFKPPPKTQMRPGGESPRNCARRRGLHVIHAAPESHRVRLHRTERTIKLVGQRSQRKGMAEQGDT